MGTTLGPESLSVYHAPTWTPWEGYQPCQTPKIDVAKLKRRKVPKTEVFNPVHEVVASRGGSLLLSYRGPGYKRCGVPEN